MTTSNTTKATMPITTHATRLQRLYDEGAHIYVAEIAHWSALGYARLLTHPKRVLWCATFPEHQGHVHQRQYTRATWHPAQQQMIFWHGARMVVTVQHHAYHRDPACADYIDGIIEWKRRLARPNAQKNLERFIEDAT